MDALQDPPESTSSGRKVKVTRLWSLPKGKSSTTDVGKERTAPLISSSLTQLETAHQPGLG